MQRIVTLSAWCFLCAPFVLWSEAGAVDPCQSGLASGQRPGPYSAVIATGPQRGQSYCYVCETGDKPGVIVFARGLSDPLGKLVQQLDKLQTEHKPSDLRVWVTFLSNDQPTLDPEVVRWGQKHAIRSVPLGVFEDVKGPPSYRLATDADVTVLLFVKRRVVSNFAFRSGELTEEQAARVLKAVPQLVAGK
jgi:hypothetical protein